MRWKLWWRPSGGRKSLTPRREIVTSPSVSKGRLRTAEFLSRDRCFPLGELCHVDSPPAEEKNLERYLHG